MTQGHLQRRLGLVSAVSITVGAVIGSGVFMKPLVVAQSLPSPTWIFVFWIALGLVCLFGAFAYAELGTMFPEAGGQYAFLREGWGRGTAFLYGWTFFWAINSGTVAALALAFADNLLPVLGVDAAPGSPPKVGLAVAMILALALVNHFGVLLGAILQNVSTFAKVGALLLIAVGGMLVVGGDTAAASAPAAVATGAPGGWSLAGLAAAFTGIFWAYEGWYQLPFNAAEMKRPARDLPLGLIGGMVVLIAVYLVINAVYLHVVPFEEMRSIPAGQDLEVAQRTVSRALSPDLAHYLTALVAISVMGAANPNLLSSPRAFYAMAQDGLVPPALTRISPRWGTPVVSIWAQAVWAVLLVIMMPYFHDVTAFVVFAGFLFYALTVGAVYRLRRLRPDLPRTYRCTGYPWTPLLFIAVSVLFVAVLLLDPAECTNALIGLGIIGAGGVFYLAFLRRRAAA